MSVDTMTPDELRDLITDAEARLERLGAVERARTDVDAAIAAYAEASDCTVVEAWRELAPGPVEPAPDPAPVEAPEWVQPQAHNPYRIGDRVAFQDGIYESVVDPNVWSPAAYPMGWRKL